jgi:hypothetical protein
MATITAEQEKEIQRTLDSLAKGNIEINHAMRLLLREMDGHSVEGIAPMLPASVLEELKKLAWAMPHSDAQWDKYVDNALGTACFDPSVTKEQMDEMIVKSKQATRRAIEALRRYFEKNEI